MKYITLTLTQDQAKQLPYIINEYLRLDNKELLSELGYIDEIEKMHYAFVRRIKSSLVKQLAKAKIS